jgi:hypothetical protein
MSRDPSPHEALDRHMPFLLSTPYRMLGGVKDVTEGRIRAPARCPTLRSPAAHLP